jgi:ABC-type amino acid transport substrate-binding protein
LLRGSVNARRKNPSRAGRVKAAVAVLLALVSAACGRYPDASVKSPSDVLGSEIGVLAGTSGEIFAERYDGGGEATVYLSAAAMMGDLRDGIIDCAIADSATSAKIAKEGKRVTVLPARLFKLELRAAAAREAFDMIDDIDSALAELKSDGTVTKLQKAYVLGKTDEIPAHPAPRAYERKLRCAVPNESSPPYIVYAEDGTASGFFPDLALFICDKIGVNLELVPLRTSRLAEAVAVGRDADFAFGWEFYSAEASDSLVYSKTYASIEMTVITRK